MICVLKHASGISMKENGRKNGMRKWAGKAAALLFWLAVWQLLALAVNNVLLVAGPRETLLRLGELMEEREFYASLCFSLLRIGAGFLAGAGAGILLAACSHKMPAVRQLLGPFMNLLKAVPVASFAVLLLIWWGSSFLAAAVCFLVVLPNLYINTLEGLANTDRQLLEMARVFRLPFRTRFFYIYRPALRPFLAGGLKLALGMCWKSGVAAEVIGTPSRSVGGRMYLSKIYLDTAGVFAWTAVVILLSVLFERGFLFLAERFFAWQPACRKPETASGERSAGKRRREKGCTREEAAEEYGGQQEKKGVEARHIDKSFPLSEDGESRYVLRDLSFACGPGEVKYLNGPSGSGKTTLLRILAGLEEPDGGYAVMPETVSMVFQEDRLCMDCSALKNVEMITGDSRRAAEALEELLAPEDLEKPCSCLSGGMKRRVALVRAMEADSGAVLLDEPYTGMDRETRARAESYIRKRLRGRALVIATHI